jgi:hypothetical protein
MSKSGERKIRTVCSTFRLAKLRCKKSWDPGSSPG